MQKLIYGLLGVLAVGFLWLCGNAISSNLAYDNWIKGLDTNKYIAADSRNGDMGDNYEGNKDAKVIISEYADYQCPFCSTVFPYLSDIVKEYDGQVGLVFRSYILSYHQNGTAAASSHTLRSFLRSNQTGSLFLPLIATITFVSILSKPPKARVIRENFLKI